VNHHTLSQHAVLEVSVNSDCSSLLFYEPQTQWKILDGVVVWNVRHKEIVRTDKISEIVKYSESDGGSFSELSDSDMCKVNSPLQQHQQQQQQRSGR
jgi:hypothetical protein